MSQRTDEQIKVFTAAASKGLSFWQLTSKALSDGVLNRPGTKDEYSISWVIARLKQGDQKVAQKLVEYSNTL